MLTVYARGGDGMVRQAADCEAALADGSALWIDLLRPDEREEALVEATLNIDAPTPAERAAIEESARFYEEAGALVLTPTMLAGRADGLFDSAGISFILARGRLLTVRTIEPRAFKIGAGRASARIETAKDAGAVLMALIEAYVERVADILQDCGTNAAALSAAIFAGEDGPDMHAALNTLGRLGAITALAHESLASVHRAAAFAQQVCERHGLGKDDLRALARDADQLERTADVFQNHLTFLLDAALGLVAAAQNRAIQRLSVAAMVFVPATLIASAFGMNFEAMSWFKAAWGPWAAFALMIAASAAVLAFARYRKWF